MNENAKPILIALAILLCAAQVRAAKPVMPVAVPASAQATQLNAAARAKAEELVRAAATLEKTDCEAAYAKYGEATDQIALLKDREAKSQLYAVVINKSEKLEACYRACQPSEHQTELLDGAKKAAEGGESRRATQIVRRMLAGKNDKCAFWADARTFLRTLPQQAEQMDGDDVDPCTLSESLTSSIDETRAAVRGERDALAALEAERGPKASRLAQMVDLYRAMDATRMRAFDLREQVLDCDKVYKPLAQDADALRASFNEAQTLVLGGYQTQLGALGAKIRAANAKLADQDQLLASHSAEMEQLKKNLDQMGALNEDLYNDLFNFAGAEAVSFSVQVEGKKIEQPIEDVRALMASESKIMETLGKNYPEYFKDGVNVEGLKRKKLVLEKVQQMLARFSPKTGNRPGFGRAVAELDATVQMMDHAIAANSPKGMVPPLPGEKVEASGVGGGSTMPWFLGGSCALLVAGLTVWRIRKSEPR